jgi:hypothetical protein
MLLGSGPSGCAVTVHVRMMKFLMLSLSARKAASIIVAARGGQGRKRRLRNSSISGSSGSSAAEQ